MQMGRQSIFDWIIGAEFGLGQSGPQITTVSAPSFNLSLLKVGNTLASAYVAGSYTSLAGAVTEAVFSFLVDGVAQAGSYVIAPGDALVSAPSIGLNIAGVPSGLSTGVADTPVQNTNPIGSDFSATVIVAAGSVVAAVLSAEGATASRCLAASTTVDTTGFDGTLYEVATTSVTKPTEAQIATGQDHTGAAAVWAGSQAITTIGTKTMNVTSGVLPGSTYYIHKMHRNGAGMDSNITTVAVTMKLPILVGQKVFSPLRNSTDQVIPLTDLTGGIAAAPAAGDVVDITYGTGSIANRAITVLAADGYTPYVAKIYQNNTEDLNLYSAYKVMGPTPDTQVSITGTLNSADAGGVIIKVYRYIDPTTPLDVAVVSGSGSGGQPIPPAITPVSPRALILVHGGGAGVTCVDFTSADLANFLAFTGNGTHDVALGVGSKDWTGGAFTAAQFGGGEAGAGNARAAIVSALRPF